MALAAVAADDGALPTLRGEDHAAVLIHLRTDRLPSLHEPEDENDHVAPTAATTRWDGSRLDHDYAVATLAAGLHSAQRRTA